MSLLIFKAVILGIVEGLTEFLPVSSTGHLILVNQWISFSEPFTQMFDVVIQLGAILAVVVYFWKKLWPFASNQDERRVTLNIWYKTIVGVLPALFFGAMLGDWIEERLFNPFVVAVALFLGGIVLVILRREKLKIKINSLSELSFKTAFLIGLIQCLAMIPGTSRSAVTIIGALLLGASPLVAVEFSFWLAIPTMVAASSYSLLKHGLAISGFEVIVLAVGFVVSFLVALAVIRFFLDYIRRHDFRIFGYYRIALAILIGLWFIF